MKDSQKTYYSLHVDSKSSDPSFESFLERLRHRFVSVNELSSHTLRSGPFKYALTQISSPTGLFAAVSCDACQLSFSTKPFELKEKGFFFIFVFNGEAKVSSSSENEEALGANDFIFTPAEKSLTVSSTKKLDLFIGLLTEAYLLTHTRHASDIFNGTVFNRHTASHKLFCSVFKTAVKSLKTIPVETHGLILDGVFYFMRPMLKELEIGAKLKSTDSLEIIRLEADQVFFRRLSEKNLRTSDVAAELGISSRYLCMAYKSMGTTPAKRLMKFRMEAASVILREEHCRELSIKEISHKVGFSQVSHFSRAFKEFSGMTPSEARYHNVL